MLGILVSLNMLKFPSNTTKTDTSMGSCKRDLKPYEKVHAKTM